MKKLCIMGAGGKMGYRVCSKLINARMYNLAFVEISDAGIEKLKELGVTSVKTMQEAVPEADVVIMAVPDVLIKKVSREVVPLMKEGALIICLDPAAAYAGVIPLRYDIGYFVVHPHHPYLFNNELNPEALNDFFGGIAKQDISCSLYRGDEKFYSIGAELARVIFGPVDKSFRVTIEQMVYCEPGLVESIGGPLIYALKLAYEKMVKDLKVQPDVAFSFLMGHLRVQFAITFGLIQAKYSDGAVLALENALKDIFKDDWLDKMISKNYINQSVEKIIGKL